MSTRNCRILEQAVAPFITNRAIMGMVQHQPFDYVLTELNRLFIGSGNYHAVFHIDHAAHLHAFKRPLQELHRTNTARTHRPQGLMVTEARNHYAQLLRGFDYLCPFRDFYLTIVDYYLCHESLKVSIYLF
jgi:hypothetical protein